MKNKTIVIYHRADFDGIFCREIAKKFLPDAELIGWHYGDPLPDLSKYSPKNTMDDNELPTVYMLDISIDQMMQYPKLIWIDHHKSAIEKYDRTTGSSEGDVATKIADYHIDGVSACRLAWQWFSEFQMHDPEAECHAMIPGSQLPTKQQFIDRKVSEPLAVRLAGEYDIWDKRDPRAELFQHGLRSRDLEDWIWDAMLGDEAKATISEVERMMEAGKKFSLLQNGNIKIPGHGDRIVENILKRGEAIQYAQTEQNKDIITSYGFDLEFEGLKFLACNHARYNSHLFTAGLKPEHDACFGFKWTGKFWEISLYHAPGKEHHDLSLIAARHGGGGHRGACGFRMDKLPFL